MKPRSAKHVSSATCDRLSPFSGSTSHSLSDAIVLSALKPILRSPSGVCSGNYLDALAEQAIDDRRKKLIEMVMEGVPPSEVKDELTSNAARREERASRGPIRDRVVQGALKLILEPIFEADFQPGSFGYRPKRTAHAAVKLVADATYGYFPPVYYFQGRVREGLKTEGFAESYRAYGRIRGKSREDALMRQVRRSTGL